MVKISHHEIGISFTSLMISGPMSSGFSHAATIAPAVHNETTLKAPFHHIRDRAIHNFAIALLTAVLSFDGFWGDAISLIHSLAKFSLLVDSSGLT
jgi:hypothetical protein